MADYHPPSPSMSSDDFVITPTLSSLPDGPESSASHLQQQFDGHSKEYKASSIVPDQAYDLSQHVLSHAAALKAADSKSTDNLTLDKHFETMTKTESGVDDELARLVGLAYIKGLKDAGDRGAALVKDKENPEVNVNKSKCKTDGNKDIEAPPSNIIATDKAPHDGVLHNGISNCHDDTVLASETVSSSPHDWDAHQGTHNKDIANNGCAYGCCMEESSSNRQVSRNNDTACHATAREQSTQDNGTHQPSLAWGSNTSATWDVSASADWNTVDQKADIEQPKLSVPYDSLGSTPIKVLVSQDEYVFFVPKEILETFLGSKWSESVSHEVTSGTVRLLEDSP